MVIERTIHNLRERPKHERKAVATLIAVGLIAVLFLGWGIIFLIRIRSGVDNIPQNTQPTSTVTQTNPITTNTYQTDAQIQQQNQAQYQTATNTVIQLGTTTY